MEEVAPATYQSPHKTYFITTGGEAGSGKGTSMDLLDVRLKGEGLKPLLIDQGLKFRTLGKLALSSEQPLDDIAALGDFINSPDTQSEMFALLADVAKMDDKQKKELLYKPAVSMASGRIGRVPSAHQVTVGLLRTEVEQAVANKVDVVLIDGRAMEKYGREFQAQGLGIFVLGWYFRCDTAIAGSRRAGMFYDHENMTGEERDHLLIEIFRVSDRNRSDGMRPVDPMVEPLRAHRLNLATYGTPDADVPFKQAQDALDVGMVTVDTSYTHSLQEMTGPFIDLSMKALKFKGAPLTHEQVGIGAAAH